MAKEDILGKDMELNIYRVSVDEANLRKLKKELNNCRLDKAKNVMILTGEVSPIKTLAMELGKECGFEVYPDEDEMLKELGGH